MDRGLLELDGKADFFFQVGKRLAIKEQAHLEGYSGGSPGIERPGKFMGR